VGGGVGRGGAGVDPSLARRRRQLVERAFELEPVDDEVAVALRRIGVLGVVVVVLERRRDPLAAVREAGARLESRRRRLRLGDLDLREVVATGAQRHAARLGPRLLSAGAHAQHVVAVARQVDRREDLAVGVEVDDRAEAAVAQRRLDLLRLEVAHGRASQLVAGQDLDGDALGRGEVLLEQERREDEDVADVVEAVAHVVGRELRGDVERRVEEVAHVFSNSTRLSGGSSRGPDRAATRRAPSEPHDSQPSARASSPRPPRVVRRRHLAALELVADLEPDADLLARVALAAKPSPTNRSKESPDCGSFRRGSRRTCRAAADHVAREVDSSAGAGGAAGVVCAASASADHGATSERNSSTSAMTSGGCYRAMPPRCRATPISPWW
jgi:hypothetical protein